MQTDVGAFLESFIPVWYGEIADEVTLEEFQEFIEDNHAEIVDIFNRWFAGELGPEEGDGASNEAAAADVNETDASEAPSAEEPPPVKSRPKRLSIVEDTADPVEAWTQGQRTRANLEAMQLVHDKRPEDMTPDDRRKLAAYSGWGGLSIAKNRDRFPPDMMLEDFGLIHEYYTPKRVADAIAQAICPLLPALGTAGKIRALEPSAGIGRLIRSMSALPCGVDVEWIAVEFSKVSARMLGALRPDIELHRGSFEGWIREHGPKYRGAINLVLANPPYGERGAARAEDPDHGYREEQSYAYFMRRAMDLVTPGGLGVFLVPAGFLTGPRNEALRRKVLLRNHLAAAYRLPSVEGKRTLFPGANLVIDCVLLRSRGGQLADIDPADRAILEGRYFEEYPKHVLGKESGKNRGEDDQVRGGAGRYRYTVTGVFTGLPPIMERPLCEACIVRPLEPPRPAVRASSPVRRIDIDLGELEPAVASAVLVGLRVDTFLSAYAAGNAEIAAGLWGELHEALVQLKASPILAEAGGNPWRSEALLRQARAGVVGAERLLAAFDRVTGELIEPLRARPTFERRYEGRADDIVAQAEWLYRSRRRAPLDELTAFHLSVGGSLPVREIRRVLLAAGWCVDGDQWDEVVPGSVYYSGDLWPKYDRAKRHEADDPQAAEQARRLLDAIAPAVFEDIDGVSPREGWVPLELRAAWLSTLNGRYGEVQLVEAGGTVRPAGLETYEALETAPALSSEVLWILGWINHDRSLFAPRSAKTDKDESIDTTRIRLDAGWTASFREWVAREAARRDALAAAYNRLFRGFIQPTYSSEPLDVARWAPDGPRPHPWQIAGARRVLENRGGLLWYDVGVGKTYTALLVIARARQEGWVKRPVILVPTSLVWKWYDDVQRVLPDYRIGVVGSRRKTLTRGPRVAKAAARLAAGEIRRQDYQRMITTSVPDTPEERAVTWTMLQAGQLDVVILSYDALARTRVNVDALIDYVDRKAAVQRILTLRRRNAAKRQGRADEDEAEETSEEDAARDAESSQLTERQEALVKHTTAGWISERLALREGMAYDPGIAWDDIGIDMLVVDEAASFKNLYMPEPREFGVPKYMGNPGEGSDRAWQLDFRAAVIRQRTGGSGIVLLSATPAKNSPLELYNLLQFIDDQAFARVGIHDPEQFIDRYLKIEARQVLDTSLSGTTHSAVVGFRNLDELRGIVFRYAEARTAEEVGIVLPTPTIQTPEVEMDARQEAKYAALVAEIEASIEQKDMSDILGKLARLALIAVHADMDEGYSWQTALHGGEQLRKIPLSSLDAWLSRGWELVSVKHKKEDERGKSTATIRRHLPKPSYSSPKFRVVAERIALTPSCGHIVFCENIAAHLWLVEVLVEHGIPRERIAMLNGKATKSPQDRLSVARGFNGDPREGVPPIYDVVIANSVAYEGVDLQTRTCAIYHVDLPWTPADLEQRNGRAWRQGNQLRTLLIVYPFALRSMDGFRYDAIQGKAGWLGDLIKSSKRETNNPGAQQDLSPEETLLMISRDREKTQRLLEEVRAKKEQERRELQAKNAARLLARANARFRDARAERDPVVAARLRGEGDALLTELQHVPADAWPWAPWTARIRDLEYLIPTDGEAPVYEGLRVGKANAVYADRVDFFEFGRLFGPMIGMRPAGKETWKILNLEEVIDLDLTAEALQRGAAAWPEAEEQQTELAIMTHLSRLTRSGLCTWEQLAWRGASDAWLEIWWPKIREQFVQGLLRAYVNDEVYPIVIGGVLHLADRTRLGEGELLPATADGFRQFVSLAPPTRLTFTELGQVAQTWWFRPFPRGYLTEARQAAATATAPETAAPTSPGPALTDARQEPPGVGPGLTRVGQEPASEPADTPVEPSLPAELQDPRSVAVLADMIDRLRERLDVRVLRSGHGYRVVHLHSRETTTIFQGVPPGTFLVSVSLWNTQDPDNHDWQPLRATWRALGRPFDQFHILRARVSEWIAEASQAARAAQASAPKDPAAPASDIPATGDTAEPFSLDSPLEEVLAALKAADPSAHALAERGDWTRLAQHGGPLAERAHAWARYHRLLPAQLRAAERLEVDAAIRGLGLAAELQAAYLDQLATAFEQGGDMGAVLDEATAHTRPTSPSLLPDLAPIPATAGLVHFTVERQELTRALLTAKAVREADDGGLGKIQVACHGTALLRVGTAGLGRSQSFFELRLLTTRCQREGDVTVQGRALHDTLRTFGDGPIEVVKAEGRNVLKLRQRALETNLPTVDYVPIDPGSGDMTPAGVITLDQLRDQLAAVVHVAQVAESSAEHLAVVRFSFEDGRLHLVATDGERLVRAVQKLPGGEALAGLQLAAADAERLRRLFAAYSQYLHPKDAQAPVRLSLSVRPGHYLSGESDALRFTLPHDPRDYPKYAEAIPRKVPDVVVVSHSELRAHLYAVRGLFGDDLPAVAQLQVRDDGALVHAEHPHTGEVVEHRIKGASSYGRPFARSIRVSRVLDILENLPSASHHALACDAGALATPLVVMPWPHHGAKTRTRTQVAEFVALGLRVGTFALVMPLRMDKEEDHGRSD